MQSHQMSIKDRVIFATKSNHEVPSKYDLPPALPNEKRHGIVLPNGDINWTCPCLGGLAYGPCGFEFREFFSCLHKIQDTDDAESLKAQECFPKFAVMKECFSQFPKLYRQDDDEDLLESTTTKLQEESSSKDSSTQSKVENTKQ